MDLSSGPGRQAGHSRTDGPEAKAFIEVASTTTVIAETPVRHAPHHDLTLTGILMDRARSLLAVMVLSTFILTFLVQPFRIPSESMERTLLVGDFLLVNKSIFGPPGHWGWLLPYRQPRHQDIVVFHFPLDPDDHVVKRLIGAPGDRVRLRDGVVYRNGQPLVEPYTEQRRAIQVGDIFRDDFPLGRFTDPGVDAHWWTELQNDLSQGDLVVPPDRYFVLGDNRTFSRDSRYWGFVPRRNIVGLPMLIYFSDREPSRTDPPPMPGPAQDDRLGNSVVGKIMNFARWNRTLRVVR
jgi:signal peptidase I